MKILRCSRSFILSNRPMATRNLPLKRGAVDAITPTLLLSTPVEDSPTKPRAKKRTKTLKPSSQGKGFEDFNRPTEQECIQVTRSLAALHGRKLSEDKPGGKGAGRKNVLDVLVRTILSQNTTDRTSQRAFDALKATFPTWDQVRVAPIESIMEPIRIGGLAEIKAGRIVAILQQLKEERGECSLEHLHDVPTAQAAAELSKFNGVGPKTVSCVLLFAMGRPDFPVDTHVWRISKAMGWVPQKATREQAYEHLNARVPDRIKYDLHVLLVDHGKCCPKCAKNGRTSKPPLGDCPLTAANLKRWSTSDH